KPSVANPHAKAFHRKLNEIRRSHPQVYEAFQQATNQAAVPRRGSNAGTFRVPASRVRAAPAQQSARQLQQADRAGFSPVVLDTSAGGESAEEAPSGAMRMSSAGSPHVPATWLRPGRN